MRTEIDHIITRFETMLHKEPWFGRSADELLGEVNPEKVFEKPGNNQHSLADLIWHMVTWAQFTLNRIEKIKDKENPDEDWRKIDPAVHGWMMGVTEFKNIHQKILGHLRQHNDEWLNEKVDYRKYNFRFLLEGLLQHDIYHLGQVAYVNKLVAG